MKLMLLAVTDTSFTPNGAVEFEADTVDDMERWNLDTFYSESENEIDEEGDAVYTFIVNIHVT